GVETCRLPRRSRPQRGGVAPRRTRRAARRLGHRGLHQRQVAARLTPPQLGRLPLPLARHLALPLGQTRWPPQPTLSSAVTSRPRTSRTESTLGQVAATRRLSAARASPTRRTVD